jgi:hypothetical protein
MRWARSWIFCAAFYYPALWLAVSCLWAFPALVRSRFLGEYIVELRPTVTGLMLWSAPSNPAAHPGAGRGFFTPLPSWLILLPLAAFIAVALIRARLTRRILGGMVVAVLADIALVLPFARFHAIVHASAPLIFSSLFFFALLCLGLRLMSTAWTGSVYWERLVGLWTSAALMPLLLWFLFRIIQPSRFINFLWMLAPPAAVAGLLASLRARKNHAAESQPIKSRAIFAGVAVILLLAAGVTWGGPMIAQAFQQQQERANQAAVAKLPPIQADAPYPKVFFQKGVSFSAEFPNPYANAGARQMVRTLYADGVNAVALIPYGGMQLGSPEVHGFGRHSWESDEGLRELTRLGHALGMKVMLKPGIWIRGGHFGGDIEFSTPAEREEWFENYGRFIERYAQLAAEIHADLFCVGGEFVRMSHYEADWRTIIANVRKVYPGPVTYAANFGDEFEAIKFWDALDFIGLQEYYPLPNDLSTAALLQKVEAVQKRFHKPVIFTEVGFPSAPNGNRHPWQDGKLGKADPQLQARCYRSIFQAFYRKPWFEGMYWWKVGSNGFGGPSDTSLTPWGKPAMQVVKNWYESSDRPNAVLNGPVAKRAGPSRQESR